MIMKDDQDVIIRYVNLIDEENGRLILDKDVNTGRWNLSCEFGVENTPSGTVGSLVEGQGETLHEALQNLVSKE
jgi:hypothetical protein